MQIVTKNLNQNIKHKNAVLLLTYIFLNLMHMLIFILDRGRIESKHETSYLSIALEFVFLPFPPEQHKVLMTKASLAEF